MDANKKDDGGINEILLKTSSQHRSICVAMNMTLKAVSLNFDIQRVDKVATCQAKIEDCEEDKRL